MIDMDAATLASTGIDCLDKDATVWLAEETRSRAAKATQKWRAMLVGARVTAPEDCLERKRARRMIKCAPFPGWQASAFVTRVDIFEKNLVEVDPAPPSKTVQNIGGPGHHAWLRTRLRLGSLPFENANDLGRKRAGSCRFASPGGRSRVRVYRRAP